MPTNLSAEIFKQNLFNTINNSGLQLCTAYYIMKDVLRELEFEYRKALDQEQREAQEGKSNEITETETIDLGPIMEESVEKIPVSDIIEVVETSEVE